MTVTGECIAVWLCCLFWICNILNLIILIDKALRWSLSTLCARRRCLQRLLPQHIINTVNNLLFWGMNWFVGFVMDLNLVSVLPLLFIALHIQYSCRSQRTVVNAVYLLVPFRVANTYQIHALLNHGRVNATRWILQSDGRRRRSMRRGFGLD